jgi:hypothetical protein
MKAVRASAPAVAQGRKYGNCLNKAIFPNESGYRVAGFASVPPINGLCGRSDPSVKQVGGRTPG